RVTTTEFMTSKMNQWHSRANRYIIRLTSSRKNLLPMWLLTQQLSSKKNQWTSRMSRLIITPHTLSQFAICTVHRPERLVHSIGSRKLKKEVSRTCVLCRNRTNRWVYSPIFPSSYISRFFNELIELTPQQRAGSEFYIDNNIRTLICTKHVKRPVTKENNGNTLPTCGASEKSHLCSECGKKLSSKYALKIHMLVHSDKKPFKCPHCDLFFRTKINRRYHIKTVHQETKACEKALHDIATSNEMKEDSSKDEPIDDWGDIKQEEPIADIFCPSTGTSHPFELSTSMEMKRNDASYKLFSCLECGKKLSDNRSLRNHMRIHSGEKPYPCPHCDKSFRDVFIRNQHFRN
ncbi:hypothetical protein PMAYCL1PPCAC_20060, partial [Pristionchus mayeri]